MLTEIQSQKMHFIRGTSLVFFYTPLCGTCKQAEKMLRVALLSLPQEVPSYRCNINYAEETAKNLRITSVPCLMVWKDGKIENTIYAFHSSAYLFEVLKQKM